MAPTYLSAADFTFLGQRMRPGHGVNPVMVEVLQAVEADLVSTSQAQGIPEQEFTTWASLTEPIIGWRSRNGLHGSGSAVDLNVDQCPYIVTRTGATLGGEAAAAQQRPMRQRAVEVYDRAVEFFSGTGQRADLSIRVNDTIEVTYDRFRLVSDALVFYLAWAFSSVPVTVNRPPIADVQDLEDGHPEFDRIGAGELGRSRDEAINGIASLFADPDWAASHQDLPSPEAQYYRMLRDYELVRIPMLYGNPTEPVTSTRNPCHGFLQLSRELVCSMINTGNQVLGGRGRMRWGASDFGAQESGDIMHFDLGGHVGFDPE